MQRVTLWRASTGVSPVWEGKASQTKNCYPLNEDFGKTTWLSVQISILGPSLARTEQRFSLHCMSNLVMCQIIMRDAEATLVLKDRKKKKVEAFDGTGP